MNLPGNRLQGNLCSGGGLYHKSCHPHVIFQLSLELIYTIGSAIQTGGHLESFDELCRAHATGTLGDDARQPHLPPQVDLQPQHEQRWAVRVPCRTGDGRPSIPKCTPTKSQQPIAAVNLSRQKLKLQDTWQVGLIGQALPGLNPREVD